MTIRRIDGYGFPILRVAGALELESCDEALFALSDALDAHPRLLGLDLSEVSRADAMAVSIVGVAASSLRKHGGRLVLLGISKAFEWALQDNRHWLAPEMIDFLAATPARG